jgi:hypothetical protein
MFCRSGRYNITHASQVILAQDCCSCSVFALSLLRWAMLLMSFYWRAQLALASPGTTNCGRDRKEGIIIIIIITNWRNLKNKQ